VTVTVRRVCRSTAEARALVESVRADTPEFVELAVDGPALTIRVVAASAASARATLDDLVACLQAAERTIGAAK
jgi:hypothetical protein